MIRVALAVWLALTLPALPHRREICPGALFFVKHGERPAWTRNKQPLCRIGQHDFYR